MKRNAIVEIICCLLILLFLYTSVSKFVNFTQFRSEVNNQPLPNWMTPFLVWIIPLAEIGISIALMVRSTRRTGLYMSLFLMSLFTVYTGMVLFRFFDRVPCSCGGVVKHLSWTEHLFFNLFFVGISLLGIYLLKSNSVQKGDYQAVITTG